MKFNDKRLTQSLPLEPETVNKLYPDTEEFSDDCKTLTHVIQVFAQSPHVFQNAYDCYIEQQALVDFLTYANEMYRLYGSEATGIFTGYYLHNPQSPHMKLAIVTKFLPAQGDKTTVTCEINDHDAVRFAVYCKEHKVLQLVWPHSHPFNMPLFYSGTDSYSLATVFYAPHQMGIVCDNLRNAFMGFKIINGVERHQRIYSFDLKTSLRQGSLSAVCLYQDQKTVNDEPMSDSQPLEPVQPPESIQPLEPDIRQLLKQLFCVLKAILMKTLEPFFAI